MAPESPKSATLVLENGRVFKGRAIGAPATRFGEIIFNTSLTGYQEILTDPSYAGQIVLMTYPEIGNYGINWDDPESQAVHASGFVVKRLSPTTSSWRAEQSLQDYLIQQGVVGIEGVDTRAITRSIRKAGAMKAGITTENIEISEFLKQIKTQPDLNQQDLVGKVSTQRAYTLTGGSKTEGQPHIQRLVVIDYGTKKSILDSLKPFAAEMVVLPAHSTYENIQSYKPQAVLLSNGPGDPATLHDAIATTRQLIEASVPTFGICLGHQIIALACGAKVSKMQLGHHGGNHPVKDLETGKITITSQNHGYAAEFEAFPEHLEVTHVNLNDHSIEGFKHKNRLVRSVQFHPEAAPGPHDSLYIFSSFIEEACLAVVS